MIHVVDVHKTFVVKDKKTHKKKTVDAVKGITFHVKPGEIYGLLGPNGAGKSTTLRMIAGLMEPQQGSIEVFGFDTKKSSEKVRKNIGFLSTDLGVYGRFSPRELLKIFGEFQGVEPQVAERRGVYLLEMLGLNDFVDVKMESFSSGQKQKVSIARALLHDPKAILFDEPTTGLDVLTAKTVLDLIKIMKGEDRAVIVSTHVMPMAEQMCDRIGIIFDGKLHGDASPKEILAQFGVGTLDEVFFKLAAGGGNV